MKIRLIAGLFALLLVVAACGDDDSAATTAAPTTTAAADTTMAADMDMEADDEEHMEDFAFGDPMDAGMADRVIEITANDDFTFSPAAVTVTAAA